jgi:transposase-like protein
MATSCRRLLSDGEKSHQNSSSFPTDDAVSKLFYLALNNIRKEWTMAIRDWKGALNRFTIQSEDWMLQNQTKTGLHKIPDTPFG